MSKLNIKDKKLSDILNKHSYNLWYEIEDRATREYVLTIDRKKFRYMESINTPRVNKSNYESKILYILAEKLYNLNMYKACNRDMETFLNRFNFKNKSSINIEKNLFTQIKCESEKLTKIFTSQEIGILLDEISNHCYF